MAISGPNAFGRKHRRERQPKFRPALHRKLESRWHDSNHRDGPLAEAQFLADDVRIASERLLPGAVAEDDHWIGSGRLLLGGESATYGWMHAESIEEVTSDRSAHQRLRVVADRKPSAQLVVGGYVFQHPRTRDEIFEI